MFYSDETYARGTVGTMDELGFYAFTEVGGVAEQREILADNGATVDEGQDFLEPGWYWVRIDSQGFVDGRLCDSEEHAEYGFREAAEMYDTYYANQDEEV